ANRDVPSHGGKPATVQVVLSSTVPDAEPVAVAAHVRTANRVPNQKNRPGPPGTTRVPSSFSDGRHNREAHSRATPTAHPTTGMSEPTVSSSTAASASPVPGRRAAPAGAAALPAEGCAP